MTNRRFVAIVFGGCCSRIRLHCCDRFVVVSGSVRLLSLRTSSSSRIKSVPIVHPVISIYLPTLLASFLAFYLSFVLSTVVFSIPSDRSVSLSLYLVGLPNVPYCSLPFETRSYNTCSFVSDISLLIDTSSTRVRNTILTIALTHQPRSLPLDVIDKYRTTFRLSLCLQQARHQCR